MIGAFRLLYKKGLSPLLEKTFFALVPVEIPALLLIFIHYRGKCV